MKLSNHYPLSLLLFTVISTSSSLTPSPVLSESDLVQCGCDNNALYRLRPAANTPEEELLTELTLIGFFSFDSAEDSRCRGLQSALTTTAHLLPAALVALDEINNSTDILSDYHLTLDFRDSQCDAVHATTEFIDNIYADTVSGVPPSNLFGVLGSECGSVAETLGGLISRSLKVPVVSYGSNFLTFQNGLRGNGAFSSLFHLSRSTLLTMQSAIGLMRHFNWTRNIAFVSQDIFLSTIESVVTIDPVSDTIELDGGNQTISAQDFTTFQLEGDELAGDELATSKSMLEFFVRVRNKSVRVILGLLSQRIAAQLICTGRLGTIPGNGFVYIFVGSFSENWWKNESESCILTSNDVQSVIVVSGNIINPNSSAILESGNAIHDFKQEYVRRLRTWCDDSAYTIDPTAGLVYDSVWALALALNRSTNYIDRIVQHGSLYDQDTSEAILKALELINFSGVTGQVQFSDGERMGTESIQQIQSGVQVGVGYFDGRFFSASRDFMWNGTNSTTLPSSEVEDIIESVGIYLWVIGLLFTAAGILFAIAMWIFNWRYATHKILLASSQKLNYVIIIGVIFGYLTVVILTILESPFGSMASDEVFKALCLLRIWMLPLSFTLSYGILFARAWRIYRVFNNPWASRRPYKDIHLMLIVLVAVAIDVLILLPWSIIDPYRRFSNPSDVDYGSFTRCVFFSCESDDIFIWLFILGLYKIVIIMCGIIVISLVRKQVIARKIYDDSRSLAAAVYVTAVAFLIGLPLTFLFILANQIALSYIVSATWVNVSSSGTLICVFIPKLYKIVIKKETGDSYRRARRLYYQESVTVLSKGWSQSFDCTLNDISLPVENVCSSIAELTETPSIAPEETDL